MVRGLIKFLSAVSAMICLAASITWVVDRSVEYSHGDNSSGFGVRIQRDFDVSYYSNAPNSVMIIGDMLNPGAGDPVLAWYTAHPDTDLHFGGIQWSRVYLPRGGAGGGATWVRDYQMQEDLIVPLWLIIAASAFLPAAHVCATSMFRHRLRRAGRCVACGYDLRATPNRCPECGACPDLVFLPPDRMR